MVSKATTVEKYLAGLPADRRGAIEAVRDVILKNLDKDYEEGMLYGMIGYFVPHRIFPAGYHCDPSKPLCYAGLASQKNHMAVYLMSVYGDTSLRRWFETAYKQSGKKLDMGQACVRFRSLDALPLEVIGEAVSKVTVDKYVDVYRRSRASTKGAAKKATKTSAKKPAKKPAKTATKAKRPAKKSRKLARSQLPEHFGRTL